MSSLYHRSEQSHLSGVAALFTPETTPNHTPFFKCDGMKFYDTDDTL